MGLTRNQGQGQNGVVTLFAGGKMGRQFEWVITQLITPIPHPPPKVPPSEQPSFNTSHSEVGSEGKMAITSKVHHFS